MNSQSLVIDVQNLTKNFGSLRAVDHLSLKVRKGETTVEEVLKCT